MTYSSAAAHDAVVSLVVTGDNHLSPALPRLSPARRQERRAWLRRGFRAAVDYAIEHHATLFVNTGDLFDSPSPTNQDRAFVAQQLRRLADAGVVCVAISGNHDTPRMQTEHGGEAPQHVYVALDELRYLSATDTLDPQVLELKGLRVAVVGLSNNPVASPGSDPLASATWSPSAMDALAQADVALVIVHAAIEGLARPNEGERIVSQASLAALPEKCRLVVAGHIHRYARQRMAGREVVIVGATEQMEFGSQSGAPGFVWVELARDGARRIEHIRTPAQPRADISLHTDRLWPATGDGAAWEDHGNHDGSEVREDSASGDARAAVNVIRRELEAACTPDTMARLRLTGTLTREQYHQLALREVIALGQRIAFSLDVDTSGLTLAERMLPLPDRATHAGALAPEQVIHVVVEETLRQELVDAPGQPSADDVRAAGELLLARLRAHGEEGG
ncbi:MAG TPA: metallophosphoesterase [Ktedonobacterales bacterium]|jgi:Icc-related predicted phosphoesterase|nr:metallophosphoesterase [Ktedonobacterales bacterium]